VLERLAGRTAETDAAVLNEVAKIAENLYSVSPERCYPWIRPMLHGDDQRTRSRAIGTLVDLGDARSIPDFIEMLEDPARRVQASARQALEQFSGRKLGQETLPWNKWYSAQREWLETEALALREQIDSQDPAEVVAAVGALSQRRVFREELVEVLSNGLWREESEIVAATCLALGQLGSKRAAPYLLDALRDSEELVRNSAWSALKLLTAEDLPLEYAAWAQRLRG
jgi:HEAT repeat protein